MAKKNFESISTQRAGNQVDTGAVYDAIERGKDRYKQQGTASPEERAERLEDMRTQGRKGCKSTRINMAISPTNYEYVKVMAGVTGRSITKTVNEIIAQHRQDHPEMYEKAKAIIDEFGGGN